MIVNLTELDKALDLIASINKEDIQQIVWMRDGKEMVNELSFDDFRFTGLANIDFYKRFVTDFNYK